MLEQYRFKSPNPGKNLLILGAVHGNEVCGTEASKNFIKKIQDGNLDLASGSVTFIPVCNPEAYRLNKRYVDKNLNRVIQKHADPTCYEEEVANVLTDFILEADYLLDLHSMHTNGTPFVFQDYKGEQRRGFANAQNLDYIFVGWPEIYSDAKVEESSATETYAYYNNVVAITVECGSHTDKKAIEVAEKCILNSLCHLGIVEDSEKCEVNKPSFIRMQKVFYKKSEGVLVNNRTHLDRIGRGEIIATYDNGEEIKAEKDCYMILPNSGCKIDDEWFYVGTDI